MIPTKKTRKNHIKLKKAVSKKSVSRKVVRKNSAKKAQEAKQAGIEMDFMGPADELGKLLFDLFQTHELETGYVKEIASDAKIEFLPPRGGNDASSAAVLLTTGLDVPERVVSNYLWDRCGAFSKSRGVRILINQTQYVNNERGLRKAIKTAIEKAA